MAVNSPYHNCLSPVWTQSKYEEKFPVLIIVQIYLLRIRSQQTNIFSPDSSPLPPTANMTKYEPMNSQDVNSIYSLLLSYPVGKCPGSCCTPSVQSCTAVQF